MLICLASDVIVEEETLIEPQKLQNRNVGGRGSLNHFGLLLEADRSPALNHVNNGFVYPKSLKCPWMETPQPPGRPFLAFLHSSSEKKILSFTT